MNTLYRRDAIYHVSGGGIRRGGKFFFDSLFNSFNLHDVYHTDAIYRVRDGGICKCGKFFPIIGKS